MQQTQKTAEKAANKACREIIKSQKMPDIYGLNKIERPNTKKAERKTKKITENAILSAYIFAWLEEADELEKMYGTKLPISFRLRLQHMKIRSDGISVKVTSGRTYYPDRELIEAGLAYIRNIPIDETIGKHYRQYEEQVEDINKAPRADWLLLLRWRTGEHAESGLTYRLTTIIRTEVDTAQASASYDVYEEAEIPCYRFNAMLDDKTCGRCRNLNGRIFRMSERKPGVNFPTIHPNCRCFIEPVTMTESEIEQEEERGRQQDREFKKKEAIDRFKRRKRRRKKKPRPRIKNASKINIKKPKEDAISE